MMIKKEIELKDLHIEKEKIEKKIAKRTNELVLSQPISFYKDLRHIKYHDVLTTLRHSLRYNGFRWVYLTISFPDSTDNPVRYHHIRNPKIQIFLFGKTKIILENIREISGRIVNGKRWMGKEVGISPEREFDIRNFI